MTATAVWTLPKPWVVPCLWPGSTLLIVCSGESVGPQQEQVRRFDGPVIAVKHGVLIRPNADVLLLAGDRGVDEASLLDVFTGAHAIVRSKLHEGMPPTVKRVSRAKNHEQLCPLKDHVCGYDLGTSAINLAWHFGATTIVLAGYDMTGGHFCKHPLQHPPADHFRRHMGPLASLNADAVSKGIRIVNVSPTSAVTAFEKQPLEVFL